MWTTLESNDKDVFINWNGASYEDRMRVYKLLSTLIAHFADRPNECFIRVCNESDIRSVAYVFDTCYNPYIYTHFVTIPHIGNQIFIGVSKNNRLVSPII